MAEKLLIHLDDQQRWSLFKQTGMHIARVVFDSENKRAFAADRSCRVCLLHEGLSNVQIESNGLCNHCNRFRVEDTNGTYSERRVEELIENLRGSGETDCVVAYSGGKDSAAALILALRKYRLRPKAVLVDNGFVPERLKQAANRFCTTQGVPLEIRSVDITKLASKLQQDGFRELPCPSCIRMIFQQVRRAAEEHHTRLVIGGHRFPPLSFPVPALPNVSQNAEIICVSPLLAIRMAETEQLKLIQQQGWVDPKLAGNTSNCALIGFMEKGHFDNQGFNPHIYEVSKEIRAGFYSKESGMQKIARPELSAEELDFVAERLAEKVGLND